MPVRRSCRQSGCITPWRWRDEHTQRATYYDGTPVTGPFNSEIMEDVLMMKAFGIPNGVYWIDRPWGPGKPWGYDDFEIDEQRLPNFARMVKWLDGKETKTVLWIAPFFQGKMVQEALGERIHACGPGATCSTATTIRWWTSPIRTREGILAGWRCKTAEAGRGRVQTGSCRRRHSREPVLTKSSTAARFARIATRIRRCT